MLKIKTIGWQETIKGTKKKSREIVAEKLLLANN